MISTSPEFTAEQLLGYEVAGKRLELVRGELVVREPAGVRHGSIGMRLAHAMLAHLEREQGETGAAHTRGTVLGADTGFILARSPDTVRAPDVAFVLAGRLSDPLPEGFADLAPDLAVEVRSPSDRAGPVLAKVSEWLSAGSRLVWVIDPAHAVVTVYREDGSVSVLQEDAILSGESLLPGFAMIVRTLLRSV